MLGFIYSAKKMNHIMQHQAHQQELHFYQSLADACQVDLCFYALNQLPSSINEHVSGFVYHSRHQTWTMRTVTLPDVNVYQHPSYLRKKKYIRNIRNLEQQGILFLNTVTHLQRDKYRIDQYLRKQEVSSYIPESAELNEEALLRLIQQYGQVFIKPKKGAKGNHIYKMEQKGQNILIKHIQPYTNILKTKVLTCAEIATFV